MNYYLAVLNAKSKRDGVDIIYSNKGTLVINRNDAKDIYCMEPLHDYTDTIIRLTSQ
jgi:hypothetical protein